MKVLLSLISLLCLSLLLIIGCIDQKKDIYCSRIIEDFAKNETHTLSKDSLNIYIDISSPMGLFLNESNGYYEKVIKKIDTYMSAIYNGKLLILEFGSNIQKSNRNINDYYRTNLRNLIYNANSTRLDLVLKHVLDNPENDLFIIITDAETEEFGIIRSRPRSGYLTAEFSKLVNKGYIIQILGFKGKWGQGISRPFYLFLISTSQQAIDRCVSQLAEQSIQSEALLLTNQFTKNKDLKIRYLEQECKLAQFIDAYENCFHISFERAQKMHLSFEISNIHLDQIHPYLIPENEFEIKSNYKISIVDLHEDNSLHYKKTEETLIEDMENEILNPTTHRTRFNVKPLGSSSANYLINYYISVKCNKVKVNLPEWVKEWTTEQDNDYSKTYYFYDIINAIYKQIIFENGLPVAEFYMLF